MASLSDLIVGEQPTWMDKIRGFMMQNPTVIVDPLGTIGRRAVEALDARTPQTIYGQEPMQAMIPTKENITAFLSKMMTNIQPNSYGKPDTNLALAYLKTRYPNRFNAMSPIVEIPASTANLTAPGGFVSGNGIVDPHSIIRSRGRTIEEIYPQKIRDLITALTHEGQHAIDYVRKASPITKPEFISIEKGGKYYKLPKNFTDAEYERYMTQPVEKRAFQAGDTGANSFDKFLDLISPSSLEKDKIATLRNFLYNAGAK